MRSSRDAVVALAGALLAACGGADSGPRAEPLPPKSIGVTSVAFAGGGRIPERHSCEGANVNPPLAWDRVPDGTRELAIVVDDPDAPRGTFVHWVVVGVDPGQRSVAEGELPRNATQARAGSGVAEYVGMCPPDGETHRYRFRVFALRRPLALGPAPTAPAAIRAIQRQALAYGELDGAFGR